MRCALVLSSNAAFEAFSGYKFRERRDRPFCHLMASPANLAGIVNSNRIVGLQMWESLRDSHIWLEFLHNSGGSRLKQLWGAAFEGKGIEQWSLLGHFLS